MPSQTVTDPSQTGRSSREETEFRGFGFRLIRAAIPCVGFSTKRQKTSSLSQGEGILKVGLDVVGEEAMRKYSNIKKYSHNVSDILELLVDKLMPTGFDRMAREGFQEALQLVNRRLPSRGEVVTQDHVRTRTDREGV
jgi:hypothetical protein